MSEREALFSPPSQLPFRNRLVYLMQTKLGTELSSDILHDIDHALYDYAKFCDQVARAEAEMNERMSAERGSIDGAEVAIEYITEWYRNSRGK